MRRLLHSYFFFQERRLNSWHSAGWAYSCNWTKWKTRNTRESVGPEVPSFTLGRRAYGEPIYTAYTVLVIDPELLNPLRGLSFTHSPSFWEKSKEESLSKGGSYCSEEELHFDAFSIAWYYAYPLPASPRPRSTMFKLHWAPGVQIVLTQRSRYKARTISYSILIEFYYEISQFFFLQFIDRAHLHPCFSTNWNIASERGDWFLCYRDWFLWIRMWPFLFIPFFSEKQFHSYEPATTQSGFRLRRPTLESFEAQESRWSLTLKMGFTGGWRLCSHLFFSSHFGISFSQRR